MSSADSRPPEMPSTASDNKPEASAAADSNRPALKKPPRRPAKPAPVEEPADDTSASKPSALKNVEAAKAIPVVPSEPEPVSEPVAAGETVMPTSEESPESPAETEEEPVVPQPRLQPISPPSEPMQYRAIGLLKGRYEPSEETFNRGNIINHDGSNTCAVLLGRTTSLVKKHLDLEKEHLWVVYPRTISPDDGGIAVQIVGVWEPETLGDEEDEAPEAPADAIQPDYFSIRGEVVKYDERKQEILVSIVQKMRTGKQPKRPFKLQISGSIGVKTIGYFWDMHVQREGNQFVLTEGNYVAAVPPKKRSKRKPAGDRMGGKRRPPKRSSRPSPKPNLAKDDSPKPDKPVEKPSMVNAGNGPAAETSNAEE